MKSAGSTSQWEAEASVACTTTTRQLDAAGSTTQWDTEASVASAINTTQLETAGRTTHWDTEASVACTTTTSQMEAAGSTTENWHVGATTAGADIINFLWKAVACAASAGRTTNRGATGCSTPGTGTTTAGCSE